MVVREKFISPIDYNMKIQLILIDEDTKVTAILTRLGLDEFIKRFKDNHIDYDAFRRLTFDDMNALKLPIDAREKIRSELSRIKSDEIKG